MNMKTLTPILSMLLTDGGISRISRNTLEIFLTSNSTELQEIFKKKMEETFQKNFEFKSISGKTVTKVRVCDEEVGNNLLEFSPSFRTRPCNIFPVCPKLKGSPEKSPCKLCLPINGFPPTKIPDFIMKGTTDIKRLALKFAMSTDGGIEFHEIKKDSRVYLQRRLILRCHNSNLLDQWANLFEECGFKLTETKNEIRITGKGQFIKFKKEIGFVNGVKNQKSKNWNNFTKNEVLEIMIDSFG